jgi:hypothetical protein
MNRRMWSSAALVLALFGSAVQAQQPAIGALGVFSLLGDTVQVVAATDAPTDTRIERLARESMDFKDIGLDLIAMRVAREAVQRQRPSARVMMFRAPAPQTLAEQRDIAAGATRAELPAWIVKTIDERKLSHLMLITRSRGPIDVRTADGDGIGRGTVEGIGFYLDTLYQIKNLDTGAVSTGLLAPYVEMRVQLMDAISGELLRSYDIKQAFAYAAQDSQAAPDPWSFMSMADKVRMLRRMVDEGMGRAMQDLLAQR